MLAMKGPAIFLAQFMGEEPFDNLENAASWMASAGYLGVQIPSGDIRCMDLQLAATSRDYCDELLGTCREAGVEITELSSHLQGQLIAVHPAYNDLFDGFAPPSLRGRPADRTAWAIDQLKLVAKASRMLGLDRSVTFSGSFAWPYIYPWPQRSPGLIREAFEELARRWTPILNFYADNGVDVCFEIHPGEDLHDGATFERFLDHVKHHPRACILYDPSHFVLQQLDYAAFIEIYHERIRMFHVKDAEFRPSGRSGVYGGFQDWRDRPGRFRSLGDGQIDFTRIFSLLTRFGFDGWAVVEWECALKDRLQGAREGAQFVRRHLIEPAADAFDDFAAVASSPDTNRRLLGLEDCREAK